MTAILPTTVQPGAAPAASKPASDSAAPEGFAALVADSDGDAPAQATDAAAPKATHPVRATTTPVAARGGAILSVLIAAAGTKQAAVAASPDAKAAADAKPEPGKGEGKQAAEAKPETGTADQAAPVPIATPVVAPQPPIALAATPHLAMPEHVAASKSAPKDDKPVATTTADTAIDKAKPAHVDAAASEPRAADPRTDSTSSGDFKASLDATAAAPLHARDTGGAAFAPAPIANSPPIIAARPGQFGHDAGIQIARQINAGQDEFVLRLNPAEHGHIQVRMRFEEDGSLRAVISADSGTMLDMLKKESGDLGRALGDAGVRTDAQSFRFDGQGQQQSGQGDRQQQRGTANWRDATADTSEDTPRFRPLRGGLGQLDRFA